MAVRSGNSDQIRPSITFCVVNYNGERHLKPALEALLRQWQAGDEVIVIDNCSTDRSIEVVRENCPDARIIALAQNRGPGAARNAGLQEAGNDLLLFLDNDVVLQAGCAGNLAAALRDNTRAVAAAPRVLYADNAGTIQYEGANSHYLGLMIPRHANLKSAECSADISTMNSLVTACFMFDSGRWGRDEPFDDAFFFNYEDHDFGIRSRVLGHELLAVPDATVLHSHGTPGLSWRPGGEYSRTRIYCLIRNRWQVILKNYSCKTILLLLPGLLIYEVFQLIGIAKKGWLGEWRRAFVWIFSHARRILELRKRVQQARLCPDRMILENGPLPFSEDLVLTGTERAARGVLNTIATGYWMLIRRLI
jgi:GT2 family glycosyltransferase